MFSPFPFTEINVCMSLHCAREVDDADNDEKNSKQNTMSFSVKAIFHYASWFEAGRRQVRSGHRSKVQGHRRRTVWLKWPVRPRVTVF